VYIVFGKTTWIRRGKCVLLLNDSTKYFVCTIIISIAMMCYYLGSYKDRIKFWLRYLNNNMITIIKLLISLQHNSIWQYFGTYYVCRHKLFMYVFFYSVQPQKYTIMRWYILFWKNYYPNQNFISKFKLAQHVINERKELWLI